MKPLILIFGIMMSSQAFAIHLELSPGTVLVQPQVAETVLYGASSSAYVPTLVNPEASALANTISSSSVELVKIRFRPTRYSEWRDLVLAKAEASKFIRELPIYFSDNAVSHITAVVTTGLKITALGAALFALNRLAGGAATASAATPPASEPGKSFAFETASTQRTAIDTINDVTSTAGGSKSPVFQ